MNYGASYCNFTSYWTPSGTTFGNGTCIPATNDKNTSSVYGTTCRPTATSTSFTCNSNECVRFPPASLTTHSTPLLALLQRRRRHRAHLPPDGSHVSVRLLAALEWRPLRQQHRLPRLDGGGLPRVSRASARAWPAPCRPIPCPCSCNTTSHACTRNATATGCIDNGDCATGNYCDVGVTPRVCRPSINWGDACNPLLESDMCRDGGYCLGTTADPTSTAGECIGPSSLPTDGRVYPAVFADKYWYYAALYGHFYCESGLAVPVMDPTSPQGYPQAAFMCARGLDWSRVGNQCASCPWKDPSYAGSEFGAP